MRKRMLWVVEVWEDGGWRPTMRAYDTRSEARYKLSLTRSQQAMKVNPNRYRITKYLPEEK